MGRYSSEFLQKVFPRIPLKKAPMKAVLNIPVYSIPSFRGRLGSRYRFPHALKLSQFPIITDLCLSEKQRWKSEQTMVGKHGEKDFIPGAGGAIITAAWDNYDIDATTKYKRAKHSDIVLKAHSSRPHPPLHARLSLERERKNSKIIYFDNMLHDLEARLTQGDFHQLQA